MGRCETVLPNLQRGQKGIRCCNHFTYYLLPRALASCYIIIVMSLKSQFQKFRNAAT